MGGPSFTFLWMPLIAAFMFAIPLWLTWMLLALSDMRRIEHDAAENRKRAERDDEADRQIYGDDFGRRHFYWLTANPK